MAKRDKLLDRLKKIERQLRKIFGDTYVQALNLPNVREAIEAGEEFTWSDNKAAEKQIDRLLNELIKQTNAFIRNNHTQAWDDAGRDISNTLAAAFSSVEYDPELLEQVTDQARDQMRERGATANNAYHEERGGFTISDRVWNLKDHSKKEIEAIIQNGMIEGKNPDEIARSVQPYLREPHRLFRRVRNKETGQLELSKAAREYKPGQGVYRSSYMNALRLARTEMTAAYRRAEWESYQNNPLITGYRIELSNNHTTLINGVPTPFHDICDDMVGDYPKTFKWTGWHPQCRCRMVPITISDEDFGKRIEALAAGKLQDWKPRNTITKMPKNFNKWIEDNSDRIHRAKALPYWMQDNEDMITIPSPAMLTANNLLQEIAEHASPRDIREILSEISNKEEAYFTQFAWNDLTTEERLEQLRKITSKYSLDILTDGRGGMSNAAYWHNSRRMDATKEEIKAINVSEEIEITRFLEGSEKIAIEAGYIRTPNSFVINSILRGGASKDTRGNEITEWDKKTIKSLDRAINKNRTTQDLKAYRLVDDNFIHDKFGIETKDLKAGDFIKAVNQHSGTDITDKGFMSASTTTGRSAFIGPNGQFYRDFILEIEVPKGTNAYFANNPRESEVIFKRGQKVIFDRIEPMGSGKYKIICIIDD